MASFFHTLQQEIADRLAADPFFQDIPCLWELKRDIAREIDVAMSQIGAGALVITPTASVESPNLPGPFYEDIGIVVQVYSDPVLAPALPRAMEIAEHVASLLHHWTPASMSTPLVGEKPTIVPAQTDNPDGDGRDVRFQCAGGRAFDVPAVERPFIASIGGSVLITCETPGAVIFYRTDGKRPVPRTATHYTGEFTPEP
ncbi:MAG: chitobiase/beta-hexosaminidase C-terminal domain-containing protein, partial [Verrucomicrobiae bacterium]|nr:chitobiase/beta-hexosaminidase C-terminal domain-containing protein [Verrucomicrobiae bacterium]